MYEDLANTKRFRDSYRVLPACTSERRKSMLRGVVPSSLGQRADRSGHGLVRDLYEAIGYFVGAHLLPAVLF